MFVLEVEGGVPHTEFCFGRSKECEEGLQEGCESGNKDE